MKVSVAVLIVLLLTGFTYEEVTRVVFFGDSITQAGVNPGGYISRIKNLATKDKRAEDYEFIGAGIGGDKVYDLYFRMSEDVLGRNPDVVLIYVGVNDVWHKDSFGTGTDPDKFEKFYVGIIRRLQSKDIQPILVTPAVIGEKKDGSNKQDADLDKFSGIIRKIATSEQLPIVDLRKIFMNHYQTSNPGNAEQGILTTDRVHLNDKGNQLVAEEMWKVIKTFKQKRK